MNSARNHQYNGSWIRLIQTCPLRYLINSPYCDRHCGPLSTKKSIWMSATFTVTIRTTTPIHINRAACGRSTISFTIRNWSASSFLRAAQSSKLRMPEVLFYPFWISDFICFGCFWKIIHYGWYPHGYKFIRLLPFYPSKLKKLSFIRNSWFCTNPSFFNISICSAVEANSADQVVEFAMEEGAMG